MLGWLRRLFGGRAAAAPSQSSPRVPAAPVRVTDEPVLPPIDDTPDEPDSEGDFTQVDEVSPDAPAIAPAITDELDLHTFQPSDCADLVDEYVRAAREAGFVSVRVIHGKGKGTLRRIVHGVLEKHPDVASFRLADGQSGSWGATLVQLEPPSARASKPAKPKPRGS